MPTFGLPYKNLSGLAFSQTAFAYTRLFNNSFCNLTINNANPYRQETQVKRFLILILTLSISLFVLAGCGKSENFVNPGDYLGGGFGGGMGGRR